MYTTMQHLLLTSSPSLTLFSDFLKVYTCVSVETMLYMKINLHVIMRNRAPKIAPCNWGNGMNHWIGWNRRPVPPFFTVMEAEGERTTCMCSTCSYLRLGVIYKSAWLLIIQSSSATSIYPTETKDQRSKSFRRAFFNIHVAALYLLLEADKVFARDGGMSISMRLLVASAPDCNFGFTFIFLMCKKNEMVVIYISLRVLF